VVFSSFGFWFKVFTCERDHRFIMSDEKMKRLRAPNITEEEKAIILYCISKEKHIVESKKTDKFNNREKKGCVGKNYFKF